MAWRCAVTMSVSSMTTSGAKACGGFWGCCRDGRCCVVASTAFAAVCEQQCVSFENVDPMVSM
eukprot:1882859-Prymnesium_polylepis.1